jgi:hypothetical protein
VEYPGVVARIEQDVCDVSAKSQSRVFRFLNLSGHRSHQMELPFHNLDLAPGIGAAAGFAA